MKLEKLDVSLWNLNFYLLFEAETCIIDNYRETETIDEEISLDTLVLCNLQSKNVLGMKSLDKVDSAIII